MHRSVLLAEVIDLLAVKTGGTYVDGTLGAGGHTQALLERVGPAGLVLGLDRDVEALARSAERLAPWGERCMLEHADYAELPEVARRCGLEQVDGVLFDLGMSSDQIEDPARGFSFAADGPLDMRMDCTRGPTAAELVAESDESELARLLWELGEERSARRVARAIVEAREQSPITTTGQLADVIEKAKGGRRGRLHPATKSFMALRMAVNHEMESLGRGLDAALNLVRVGGRVAAISFHSIEDRRVKRCFARHVGRWESLPEGGQRWSGEEPAAERITRKPVTASQEEIEDNPRARSAKLRVVERIR